MACDNCMKSEGFSSSTLLFFFGYLESLKQKLTSPWILIYLDAPMPEKGDPELFLPYPYKP